MIKIIGALVVGVVLAVGSSFAVTSVATTSAQPEPVNESLYNYGDR